MDPLAIATNKGEGEAIVFKSDNKDPYDIYQADRARRDAMLAQKKAAQAKTQAQRLQDLEDLNKLAVEGHISYLDEEGQMKNAMIAKASDALMKSGGTADINQVIYKDLTEFQKTRDTAKQVEAWASQVGQVINTDRNKLDDSSVEQVKSFLKLKPSEKKEYLLKSGFPQLKHKEEFQDYNADLRSIGKQIGQDLGGGSVMDAEGNITTTTTKTTPKENILATADLYVKSGLNKNNPNPKAAKLISDTRDLLANDPLFNILPPEQQLQQVINKANEYAIKELEIVQTEENRNRLSRAPKLTAAEKVVEVIPEKDAEVNVALVGTGEKSSEAVDKGAVGVTRWRFPKTVTVQANPNTVFDINTGKAEKSYGDYKMTVSEVVKAPIIEDKDGNYYILPKHKIAEYKKKYPDMKGVSNKKFASVIYENEDGEEVKKYIPYEVIENQIKEQKLNLRDESPSKNTISLKDARSANPGVSDADLKKNYAKFGYTVE